MMICNATIISIFVKNALPSSDYTSNFGEIVATL